MKYFGVKALIFAVACVVATAQTTKIKEVPVKLSGTTDGAQLYREHCAVCHGVDAKGAGPAAPALKKAPTDLTTISKRNAGKYPSLAVQQKIKGGEITEHGTVDMPIWGKLLIPTGKGKTDADIRVYALMQYIEKIQTQ